MTTAVRASTRGAGWADAHRDGTGARSTASTSAGLASAGAAVAGVAIHPTSRPSTTRREGNRGKRERTAVGCTNPWKECNPLDPDGRGTPDGGERRLAPPPGDRRELGTGPSTSARLRLRAPWATGPSTGFRKAPRRYLQGW